MGLAGENRKSVLVKKVRRPGQTGVGVEYEELTLSPRNKVGRESETLLGGRAIEEKKGFHKTRKKK